MELLVHIAWKWLEERFRPRLAAAVPDLDALEDDPAGYLAETGGVHVGPRRYVLAAVFGGAILGGGLAALIGAAVWAEAGGRGGTNWGAVAGGVLGAAVGIPLVRYVTRGGDLHLLPSGVVLSYRGWDVVCPWEAFDPSRPVVHTDETWSALPLRPWAADRVALLRREEVRASGAGVRATHARAARPSVFARVFRGADPGAAPAELYVRDFYAPRRDELFPLLLRVAWRLTGPVR